MGEAAIAKLAKKWLTASGIKSWLEDMKGSAAAVMSAASALAGSDFPGRVLIALVVDEEYASLGAQDFVRRHNADACILTEPREGRLVLAHKGFVWADIVTTGKAAHGSRWDLGVSAIVKMGKIITALERFDEQVLRNRTHPLVGPASQHCSMIRGGSGLSTYAEECSLQVERRPFQARRLNESCKNCEKWSGVRTNGHRFATYSNALR